MTVNIYPLRLIKFLIIAIISFTLIHSMLQFVEYGLGFTKIQLLRVLFDFELDSNITTWYSSVTLFISSLILLTIAIVKKGIADPFALHWQFLSVIFAFLSLDEVAMIHERMGEILETLSPVEFDGWLYFQWVLIGLPVTLVVGFAYAKFLLHLPARTRNLIILAGGLFIGGALGLEILAGYQESLNTGSDFVYKLITTVEELWEKLGVMVFIYALLSYMEKYIGSIQLLISDNPKSLAKQKSTQLRDRNYSGK